MDLHSDDSFSGRMGRDMCHDPPTIPEYRRRHSDLDRQTFRNPKDMWQPSVYNNQDILPQLHSIIHAPFQTSLPSIADILASHDTQERPRSRTDSMLMCNMFSFTETYLTNAEEEDMSPWPSADQYHAILRESICSARSGTPNHIPTYHLGYDSRSVALHPNFIYTKPKSCMYLLPCKRLLGKGSFGFPRYRPTLEGKGKGLSLEQTLGQFASKEFEWRKMSFVTGLPKKRPLVRYVTATCYARALRIEGSYKEKKKVFRMHAVMLATEDGTKEMGDYVLVHIRAGASKRTGVRAVKGAKNQFMEVEKAPEIMSASCLEPDEYKEHRSYSNSSACTVASVSEASDADITMGQ